MRSLYQKLRIPGEICAYWWETSGTTIRNAETRHVRSLDGLGPAEVRVQNLVHKFESGPERAVDVLCSSAFCALDVQNFTTLEPINTSDAWKLNLFSRKWWFLPRAILERSNMRHHPSLSLPAFENGPVRTRSESVQTSSAESFTVDRTCGHGPKIWTGAAPDFRHVWP